MIHLLLSFSPDVIKWISIWKLIKLLFLTLKRFLIILKRFWLNLESLILSQKIFGKNFVFFIIKIWFVLATLNKWEKPSKIVVVTDFWTPENELVTSIMKIRRFKIKEFYSHLLWMFIRFLSHLLWTPINCFFKIPDFCKYFTLLEFNKFIESWFKFYSFINNSKFI